MATEYYNNQIERYLSQIIRAFSIFTVSDGVVRDGLTHTEKVPVIFGSPSRVVAAIVSGDAKFRNVKVPIMSVNLTGISLDDEAKLNRYHQNEMTYRDSADGVMKNVKRTTGCALRLEIDLNIYASSVSQLMEIFERVALTFNPEVVIQKSTDVFDSDYITAIRLEGISNNITSPLGANNRVAELALQFSIPVRLSYPDQATSPLEAIRLKIMEDPSGNLMSDDLISVIEQEEVLS